MSRFDDCLRFVLDREGGYVDDPDDAGGATNFGITQRVYDQFRKLGGSPARPVSGITPEEVAAIYRGAYWKPLWCDVLPEPLDLVAFDSAVNHGMRQAGLLLQRAAGADADGVIGRQTIAAVREMVMSGRLGELIDDILRQRSEFYDALVVRKPSQAKFRKGWGNRLAALEQAVRA